MAGGSGGDPNSTYTNVGKYAALDSLYFLLFALTTGAFFLFVKRRGYGYLPVPAMQFLCGMIVGLIHTATKDGQDHYYLGGLGDLSEGIEVWTHIDPHLLAAVFLPALIFSDAMQVDFHLFRRLFLQSLLLATVGVAMQMCAMAMLATFFLASTGIVWSMPFCFAFGAALSATDPVAVVAMLESVQAPAKLTTLMSGESHLSDLVALVSFNIFLYASVDVSYTQDTDKIVSYVMSMIFGGPALGLLFGLLALQAIRMSCAPNNDEDTLIQITITIVCAYFSFIISENNVKGNGVLATVTSALVISAYAWPSFSKPEAIEHVWKTIEFFASAVVFCFGGLAFGMTAYEYYDTEYVPADLYGTCVFLWLMLYAVRGSIILILYPFLSHLGYGIRWNEAVSLTWGSLRGAVAIVLGLVMFETDTVNTRVSPADQNSKRDSVQFFFLVAGIVFLSIIVNSSTAPLVMKALKVLSKSDVQKMLLRGLKIRIHTRAEDTFARVVQDQEYATVRKDKLGQVITAFDETKAQKFLQPHLANHRLGARFLIWLGLRERDPVRKVVNVNAHVCDVETLEVVRELFLDIVKAGYWDMIKDGTLPKNSAATRTLLQSVDIAKDEVEAPLCDLDLLHLHYSQEEAESAWHARVFAKIDKCLPSWVKIDDYLGAKVHGMIQQNNIYAATCFVRSHAQAQLKLARYVGDDDSADSPEECVVIEESQAQVERALHFLKACSASDSHIVDLVTTKKVGSRVLEDQRALIFELFSQGVLDERGEMNLLHQVEDQLAKLQALSLSKFEARKSIAENGESMLRAAVSTKISGINGGSRSNTVVDAEETSDNQA